MNLYFPHPEAVNDEGLVAIGGDLSVKRLLLAYHFGIFPWYNEDDPILWWSPNPRCVLVPEELLVSKSMRLLLRKQTFEVTINQDFENVMRACRTTLRKGQSGTWINQDMIEAYTNLHQLGYAHSVEVWSEKELVGGLYGIALGKIFFGESMFSRESNASKFGFIHFVQFLQRERFTLIDCQQDTPHLRSLGAKIITRSEFFVLLRKNNLLDTSYRGWTGHLSTRGDR